MKKKVFNKTVKYVISIIFIILVSWIIIENIDTSKENIDNNTFNKNTTESNLNSMVLYFYDNKTNCKLNGELYAGDTFIGEFKNGSFNLSHENYTKYFYLDGQFYITGLTDSCFKENGNLPYMEVWNVSDLENDIQNNKSYKFVADLTPRSPRYYGEMMGFVRPEETRDYLAKYITFENNTETDLDNIANFAIRYRADSLLFNQADYWQTPKEALDRREGDCEDWVIAILSAMREYNNSLECYGALWDTHLSVICFLGNKMIIYDQGQTKFLATLNSPGLTELERKAKIRSTRNDYFEYYGIESNQRMLHALFNEKDLITFKTEEDFVNWVANR